MTMPAMAPPDRLLPPPPLDGGAFAGMVMPPGLKLLRDTLLTSIPASAHLCGWRISQRERAYAPTALCCQGHLASPLGAAHRQKVAADL